MRWEKLSGVGFLILFWLSSFLFAKGSGSPSNFISLPPPLLLEPLTLQEKILTGRPLDINKLSEKEWDLLPHIGPQLASRIIEYRRQNGPFKRVEELLSVKGMGEKTLTHIVSFLTVF